MKMTTEEKKEAKRECDRKYYLEHRNTPLGRARMLLSSYNKNDKKYNRGKGDLTARWIVENIFNKPCVHCGKEGWDVIGCNRLDNSLPHSKDNVEPCCKNCNDRLHYEEGPSAETRQKMSENNAKPMLGKFSKDHPTSKAVIQSTKDDRFVRRWDSMSDIERELGYRHQHISECCLGKRKSAYDYQWQFE